MNIQNRQINKDKVDQRLPEAEGTRGNEELLLNGYKASVWGNESLEIDTVDIYTMQ